MREPNRGLNGLAAELRRVIPDPERVSTDPAILEQASHDHYWYSPVLRPLLAPRLAEVAVQPESTEEIRALLRLAYAHNIPVTARGAGTANSGQSVPLEGGIVMDLSRMDTLEKITPDGVAVCQTGVRMGAVERQARERGWELRCYPTTLTKATVGGFLAAGSGGVGSVAWGGIRDFDNVAAVEIVTMEREPELVRLEGLSAKQVLHAWGTNGIITRAWLRLTPARAWVETAACFPTWEQAYHFSETLAGDKSWTKRLVTVFEWPVPSFFTSLKESIRPGQALALMMVAVGEHPALDELVQEFGGEITLEQPFGGPQAAMRLSDYTWNHTTQWAMEADPAWTYLQLVSRPGAVLEQCRRLRERYGDTILFHFEFMRNRDNVVVPAGLPLVRFSSGGQIAEMIEFCRSLGIYVANPHAYTLEDSGRLRLDNLQLLGKLHYDHRGLLNPGKMRTFTPS